MKSTGAGASDSFRLEIGNVSRRIAASDSGEAGRRSYSIGSFDYLVDDDSEISVSHAHRRSVSDKDDSGVLRTRPAPPSAPPELDSTLGPDVAAGRSWLKDYIDRLSASISSRAMSFRSSGRFFSGSSRRSEVSGAGEWDLESNRVGEEITEMFRWLSDSSYPRSLGEDAKGLGTSIDCTQFQSFQIRNVLRLLVRSAPKEQFKKLLVDGVFAFNDAEAELDTARSSWRDGHYADASNRVLAALKFGQAYEDLLESQVPAGTIAKMIETFEGLAIASAGVLKEL
ncbi:hypothetical protein CMV_026108 [Castanea mollissima]|uniref:Uncharacterized protein n=1 Tax=Castanea mollissima TaxID=60419 RepID=A0A8J4VAR6_9ROSI|nr:hypothetical protein CMV_026108 [Castanea mollissima]